MISKRVFDLSFVLPALVILLPVFVFVAVWIKSGSKGPVFFRQERVGLAGEIFLIYKFRSMVVGAEALGARVTVGKDSRITKSGKFLRKYKIDELPQLINVLRGEMSLVGPRPEVPEYVAYWPPVTRELILSVPPGITDLASIEFRNEADLLASAIDPVETYIREIMPVKLKYYEEYVNNRNIFLDFRLVLITIGVIFR